MSRSVPEWIGRTDDSVPPPSVKLRIFRTAEGRCHISGVKINPGDAWEVEHVIPLSMGGKNRESNLAPALVHEHKKKTAQEAGDRSRMDRAAARHLGLKKPSGSWGYSKFKKKLDGSVVLR